MHIPELQPVLLPFLITTEHYFPGIQWQIRGDGLIFVNTIRDATKTGGLWLLMQDSDGKVAAAQDDIVSYARIVEIDWLSTDQIRVDIVVDSLGVISSTTPQHHHIKAKPLPLWRTEKIEPSTNLLAAKLKTLLLEHHHESNYKASTLASPPNAFEADFDDPCWLCWRWLELLPLPLKTKQKLLRHSSPDVCLRYLKKIINQSDRLAQLLR